MPDILSWQIPACRVTRPRTRLIADLAPDSAANVFRAADPYRVVIDLPEVHFQLDEAGRSRGPAASFRPIASGLICAGHVAHRP